MDRNHCRRFRNTGTCKFGDNCRFKHVSNAAAAEEASASLPGAAPPKAAKKRRQASPAPLSAKSVMKTAPNTQATFDKWMDMVPREDLDEAPKLFGALPGFFQTALKLASGDAGMMQEVIMVLASDGGLLRIKELVDRNYKSDETLADFFSTHISPLFELLSLRSVVTSIVLERCVGGLHIFLYGNGGQRALALFAATARFVELVGKDAMKDADAKSVECALAVMSKTFEIDGAAQVTEPFVAIINRISTVVEAETNQHAATHDTIRHLRNIKGRFNVGLRIPQARSAIDNTPKPAFSMKKDLPGELSAEGPRHDNDFSDIRNIKIMPTSQEILASRPEYLPSYEPSEFHIAGLAGLLDRHFRLVREDTVGQTRDAAKFALERLQDPVVGSANKEQKRQSTRSHIYESVRFEDFGFDNRNGLEFAISFEQPHQGRLSSSKERQQWWENSKRLGNDALVCLLDTAGSATFLMVSVPPELTGVAKRHMPLTHHLHKTYSRHADSRRSYAVVRLIDLDKGSAKQVFSFFNSEERRAQMILVEFPGVLVPAFYPTLRALQKMSTSLDLPFSDLILQQGGINTNVSAPAYAVHPHFTYDLTAVTGGEPQTLKLDAAGLPVGFDMETFKALTTLDSGQAEALVASLTRNMALIQGPPGTGKSYTGVGLIRVLLDNKLRGELGPIICVCYTNHALDQLLEHVLEAEVSQIIRIGSRSKSEKLSELNLRAVARKVLRTKPESMERRRLQATLSSVGTASKSSLHALASAGTQPSVQGYLEDKFPHHNKQLFMLQKEDGFMDVDHHFQTRMNRWLRGELFPPPEINRLRSTDWLLEESLLTMSLAERASLYQFWTEEIKLEIRGHLAKALSDFSSIRRQLDMLRGEADLRCLVEANVIGITTSGLARNLPLLRKLTSKVLICEEAGEVQESHLLTALLPSLEHVILIGDHKQLRPQVQNYNLSSESHEGKEYCLDYSLFERFVNPLSKLSRPLPLSTLQTQRRMHPSISELIRSTIYPALEDAPNTLEYPEVSGLRRRLFWLDHEHKENNRNDDLHATSATNDWEVEMTAALVSHVVRQGVYKPSDIAVLTPYLGQLARLRDRMSQTFEIMLGEGDIEDLDEVKDEDRQDESTTSVADDDDDIASTASNTTIARGTLLEALRLATVDNFQGEEAKVVIISLVRSNDEGKPGFLKTENRANVLLSRAQHGMYIIGNVKMFDNADRSPMWSNIIDILKSNGNVGRTLDLRCNRRPETALEVREPDDFLNISPEAGCNKACAKRLECGHACPNRCHADLLHDAVYCQEDCQRPPGGCSDHQCVRKCGDKCPTQCDFTMQDLNLELGCGHVVKELPCFQAKNPDAITCRELVLKNVPGCKHSVIVQCCVDVASTDYRCSEICGASLECSHTCRKSCSQCNKRTKDEILRPDHGTCRAICGKTHQSCGHAHTDRCHDGDCPSCDATCNVQCVHSTCSRLCPEPCIPCIETCASACPHSACQMPCAAPCDWIPCSRRCEELMNCGCRCVSICGEACPSSKYCQSHGDPEVLRQVVDFIGLTEYQDLDLNEDPAIILDCGHLFTLKSLDGTMGMQEYYELDEHSRPISIKSSNLPFSAKEIKSCPNCRGSMRNIARYGRIVRRALLDISTKKFIIWSNDEYVPVMRWFLDEHEKLAATTEGAELSSKDMRLIGTSDDQITMLRARGGLARYGAMFYIRRRIILFLQAVHLSEQPFQRVRNAVEFVRRQKAADGEHLDPFDFDQSLLQTRAQLLGFALFLRCDLALLSDALIARQNSPLTTTGDELIVDFCTNREDCAQLILQARSSKQIVQAAEGEIFWARFAALERTATAEEEDVALGRQDRPMARLRTEALAHLDAAEAICTANPSQTRAVAHEVDEIRKMLRESVFYTPVSTDEMRAVVAATSREFNVQGHWYTCANGHPFTIGECGGPMETSRCPQCGATIGGVDHMAAEGVTGFRAVEELAQ